MQTRKLLISAIVGALCLTAAIAVVVLVSGSFDDTAWRILATTSAISFFGLLGVPVGMLVERGRALLLARASAALTGGAFLLTLALIWRDWENGFGKLWGIVLALALATAQAAVVEARRRESDTHAISLLVALTVLSSAVLATMGVVAILAEIDNGAYYRVLGSVAVIDLLLVAVAAVLRRGVGSLAEPYRLRVNGQLVESPGRDFAAAVAAAIRTAEREGKTVQRIERV